MAITKQTVKKLSGFNIADANTKAPADVSCSAGTDYYFDLTNLADEKVVFEITNSGASKLTLTVYKGDGVQAVEDATLEIPASETHILQFESAKFKILKGEAKGCLKLKCSASATIRAFSLR